MISVLVPSCYPKNFSRLIDSLLATCSNKDEVEIVVKVDTEMLLADKRSYGRKLKASGFKWKIIVTPRRRGYKDMNIFWNELAEASTGQWMWMMNDDVIVTTGDWVACIKELESQFADRLCIGAPVKRVKGRRSYKSAYGFCIIPRLWYERLGYIAPEGVCADRFVRDLSTFISRKYICSEVYVFHPSGRHGDAAAEPVLKPEEPILLGELAERLLA